MDERLVTFLKFHKPEHKADPMVYEVWEDGEITLTKGGELYGQRNLHCIWPGDMTKSIPPNEFGPEYQRFGHARIIVGSSKEAELARKVIIG